MNKKNSAKKLKIEQLKFFKTPSLDRAKEELNTLLADQSSKKAIRLILFSMALSFLIVAFSFNKLPPELPLLYSKPWGKSQLVSKNMYLILPAVCFLTLLVNLRLTSFFFKKESLLSKIIIWTTVVICLLTVVNIIKTVTILLF